MSSIVIGRIFVFMLLDLWHKRDINRTMGKMRKIESTGTGGNNQKGRYTIAKWES